MDNEFMRQLEMRLDDMNSRLKSAELALTQVPQINFQVDPSRPAGVIVEPDSLVLN
jgi:hypothetical protein